MSGPSRCPPREHSLSLRLSEAEVRLLWNGAVPGEGSFPLDSRPGMAESHQQGPWEGSAPRSKAARRDERPGPPAPVPAFLLGLGPASWLRAQVWSLPWPFRAVGPRPPSSPSPGLIFKAVIPAELLEWCLACSSHSILVIL